MYSYEGMSWNCYGLLNSRFYGYSINNLERVAFGIALRKI